MCVFVAKKAKDSSVTGVWEQGSRVFQFLLGAFETSMTDE